MNTIPRSEAVVARKRSGWLRQAVVRGVMLLILPLLTSIAQIPQLLNYQGRVQVGTTDFNGTGQFKFALVNADGTTTYWSNDGTASGQPASAVNLPVSRGLYSVLLGNTALPNMTALPPAALANGDAHLRVWFNDGLSGFQQFAPDQRVVTPPYAAMAGALAGSIGVHQLPVGVPYATNGTTAIVGDVVVQGTITAADVNSSGPATASGLPPGSRVEVLINNAVAPGVRFDGLNPEEIRLSRVITDLSWPGVFGPVTPTSITRVPVAVRLSLPNGGVITWSLPGSDPNELFPSYAHIFTRPIGRDGKPFDRVILRRMGGSIRRLEENLAATGSLPVLALAGLASGQPPASVLRLIVDGVNYNNVALQGEIEPTLETPVSFIINASFHRNLSQWALAKDITQSRGVEIVLVNGLAGLISLANVPHDGGKEQSSGVIASGYEVRIAADGLPYEVITIEKGGGNP